MQTIQTKVAIGAGVAVALTVAALAGFVARSAYRAQVDAASAQALAGSKQQGAQVKARMEVALTTARSLANSLAAAKAGGDTPPLGREQVIGMLRQVALRTEGIVGVYTAWEPNAFDGKDAQYARKPGHDATGRMLPYLVRSSRGQVTLEPLADQDLNAANQRRGKVSELDFDAGYSRTFEKTTLSGGLIRYTFPNTTAPSTTELYGGIALPGPLHPAFKAYVDVEVIDGAYLTFDVSHARAMTRLSQNLTWSVEMSAGLGAGTAGYNKGYFGASASRRGWATPRWWIQPCGAAWCPRPTASSAASASRSLSSRMHGGRRQDSIHAAA